MRLVVVEHPSDLQTEISQLLNDGGKSTSKAAAGNALFERIKSLNPHVDFQHLPAGTLLLVPDAPELKQSETSLIAGNAFTDFTTPITEGLQALAERVRTGFDGLATDNAAVAAVLKTTDVKRQIESDPLLGPQLDEASKEFAATQERAKEAATQVKAMLKTLANEFGALGKLLS